MTEFKSIAIKEITPDKNQPRRIYDEAAMQELTQSVKEKGVLQPVLIRPNGKGFIMVCGERRLRAAIAAGLAEMPAVIRELGDDEALELQIIENLQRKDVHPMEEAVAFKSLLENKNRTHTVEEIAAIVGKSIYYVRQRMKLNSLTKDWQEVFYKNKMQVSLALTIASIPDKDQADLYKAKISRNQLDMPTYHIEIHYYDIERIQRKLKSAPFDKKDPTLSPLGACTTCPFNSAVNSLFPEDAQDPICNNPADYDLKCQNAFNIKFAEVKDDPEYVLIYDYLRNAADEKFKIILKKDGHKVYTTGYSSTEPSCSRVAESNKDFKKLRDAGKAIKGFYIGGNEKGNTIWVTLGKATSGSTAKSAAEKIKSGKVSVSDIDDEISRIQDREKRSKELDAEKIWKSVRELLTEDVRPKLFTDAPLSEQEKTSLAVAIMDKVGHENSDDYETFGLDEDIKKISDKNLNKLFRIFILDVLVGTYGSHIEGNGNNWRAFNFIKSFLPKEVAMVEKETAEAITKRIERVNKRIADLRVQKKELSDKKPAAKKPVDEAILKLNIKVDRAKKPAKKKAVNNKVNTPPPPQIKS